RTGIEDQYGAVRGDLAGHETTPGSCATNDYIVCISHESPSLLLVQPREAPLFKNPDLHFGPSECYPQTGAGYMGKTIIVAISVLVSSRYRRRSVDKWAN